jgi:hypothetical protein
MFRSLMRHLQVYCLCLGAELYFNMVPNFEYDYVICNIMLSNKILDIMHSLVQPT